VVVIPQSGTGAVSVRLHHGGPQGAKPKGEVIANILTAIKERRAQLYSPESRGIQRTPCFEPFVLFR
jgi:hypothetical protein